MARRTSRPDGVGCLWLTLHQRVSEDVCQMDPNQDDGNRPQSGLRPETLEADESGDRSDIQTRRYDILPPRRRSDQPLLTVLELLRNLAGRMLHRLGHAPVLL